MLTRFQMMDDTVYISHYTNTLSKSINLIILPSAMHK